MANVVLHVQDKLRVAAERHGKARTKEPASGSSGHALTRRQVNEYEDISCLIEPRKNTCQYVVSVHFSTYEHSALVSNATLARKKDRHEQRAQESASCSHQFVMPAAYNLHDTLSVCTCDYGHVQAVQRASAFDVGLSRT